MVDEQNDYAGCFGEIVSYEDLRVFLNDVFTQNSEREENSSEKFATCVWGTSGIGKTAIIKQLGNIPVVWRGKEYPGYNVIDVPLAQFEEMGDLHGMPARHVLVSKQNGKGPVSHWVPEEVLSGYISDGFQVEHKAGIKTMYAPPDWVPTEAGPSILLLDDWNRASLRIVKGCMQLLQNYGMMSWKLPEGCHIVMTANPDEQDYLVTSLDPAILTRQRHITLKHDAKQWAIWATKEKIDNRVINFVLRYPEMMTGKELTSPRTLSEVGRSIKNIPNLSSKRDMKRFKMIASSLIDEETVTSLIVFIERDVELIIEPEQILKGEPHVAKHIHKLMTATEKRIDIIAVTCDRLFAYLIQDDTPTTEVFIRNFQKFITSSDLPEDMRHNICMRLSRNESGNGTPWILNNKLLTKLIMDVI